MGNRILRPRAEQVGAGPVPRNDSDSWAERIARGELRFPSGLDADDALGLAGQVQSIRRAHLLEFLARQVARHLAASSSDHTEEIPDVKKSV